MTDEEQSSYRSTKHSTWSTTREHTQPPRRKKSRFEIFESPSKTLDVSLHNLNHPLSQSRSHYISVQDHRSNTPGTTPTTRSTTTAFTQTTKHISSSNNNNNMKTPPPPPPPSTNHHDHDETEQTSSSAAPIVEYASDDVVMYDDIERLVCHEDVPQLLALAVNVKQLYQSLTLVPAPVPVKASQMDPREVLAVVDRIQRQHCSQQKPTVHRGTFPLTDSILEESLLILQAEVERCEHHILQRQQQEAVMQRQQQEAAFHHIEEPAEDIASPRRRRSGGKANSSNGIATKYAKWQTDILMEWMMENLEHPFPTPAEVEALAQRTCLVPTQIVNWTTNVRKRNWKATVAQGKKPHHFIDFLFLAQDRDQRQALEEANAGVSISTSNTSSSTPVRRGRSKNKGKRSSRKHGTVKTKTGLAREETNEADDNDDLRDPPVSEVFSPCHTPKGKSAAVSPSTSSATAKSPHPPDHDDDGDDDGVEDAATSGRTMNRPVESLGAKSFGSMTATPQAKGSFVSPCMSPAPHHDPRTKHPWQPHNRYHHPQGTLGTGDMMNHHHYPQAPPSPYRVTHYHPPAHYSRHQPHVPPAATPFLPRPCGMSSDHYFYNPAQSPVTSSSTSQMPLYPENDIRQQHPQPHHAPEGQLHSVSESFDNNSSSNDAAMMGPTDPLDPWGDEEHDCAHATGNGSGPSALMDAFAHYWFEKCQDQDDDEEDGDEDDDKSAVSASSSKTIPTGPSRFDSSLSPSREFDNHQQHRHHSYQQTYYHHHHHHMASSQHQQQQHHLTATSHAQRPDMMNHSEFQVDVAIAASFNVCIRSHSKSPARRRCATNNSATEREDFVVDHDTEEQKSHESSLNQLKPPEDTYTSVTRWHGSKTISMANDNGSKMKTRMKRQRSASFSDDDEDEEEWANGTTTPPSSHHAQDGLDVADFIRELGLESAHDND